MYGAPKGSCNGDGRKNEMGGQIKFHCLCLLLRPPKKRLHSSEILCIQLPNSLCENTKLVMGII